jgi:hypothetical protein
MKFRRRYLNFSLYSNKTLLAGDEFSENRRIEKSYTLLQGVNEFILVLSTFTVQFGRNTMMQSTASFVKIRETDCHTFVYAYIKLRVHVYRKNGCNFESKNRHNEASVPRDGVNYL